MGIIKEPLEIDFEVDNRPLTKEEEKMISDFIRMRNCLLYTSRCV